MQLIMNLATVSSFLFFTSSQLDLKVRGGVEKIQHTNSRISSIPREDHVGDHWDEVVEEGDDQADDGDQGDDGRGEPINHQEDDSHDASCEARVPILS